MRDRQRLSKFCLDTYLHAVDLVDEPGGSRYADPRQLTCCRGTNRTGWDLEGRRARDRLART